MALSCALQRCDWLKGCAGSRQMSSLLFPLPLPLPLHRLLQPTTAVSSFPSPTLAHAHAQSTQFAPGRQRHSAHGNMLVQHGNMLLLLRMPAGRRVGRCCARTHALLLRRSFNFALHSDVSSDVDGDSDASFVIVQASLGHATQI